MFLFLGNYVLVIKVKEENELTLQSCDGRSCRMRHRISVSFAGYIHTHTHTHICIYIYRKAIATILVYEFFECLAIVSRFPNLISPD